MGADDLARIKEKFDEIYEAWEVELPEADLAERRPGSLRQGNGSGLIRYVFGASERGEYLEYYSFHRIGGDSHRRIYASGEIESLDVLETMLVVSQDPEEMARREEEMHERNRRLIEELDRAGLHEGGPVPTSFEMNAYLVTGDREAELNQERAERKITAVVGDITKQQVDAIVNAANSSLLGGGGVDGAIHRAGGPEILAECKRLRETDYPDGLPTGKAVATTAGQLPARWVIHTVGPVYSSSNDPAGELRSCYTESLRVADELGATSIALPAISTGAFGYPMEEAAREAVAAVRSYPTGGSVTGSTFVLFDQRSHDAFAAALA